MLCPTEPQERRSQSWVTVRGLFTHDWLADGQDRRLVIDPLTGLTGRLLGWQEEGQGFLLMDYGSTRVESHLKMMDPCRLGFFFWGGGAPDGVTRRNFSSLLPPHHAARPRQRSSMLMPTKPVAPPRLPAKRRESTPHTPNTRR